jgi:glycosyltransferase involved in cell wall biosynthesis
MATILILIGAHLCTAPRPLKEANALSAAGHNVTVRGAWFDPVLAERDLAISRSVRWQFEPYLDFRKVFNRLYNLQIRIRGRLAREVFTKTGWFTPDLLGYGATQMLTVSMQAKANLTIVHSEAGLWVASKLLDRGFNVGVDFEDWFSEDLLPEARKIRPIAKLKQLEHRLMRECRFRVTTSHSLARAMASAFQASTPTVLYNTFPWKERANIDGLYKDRRLINIPSLHWFSQTIGPGRGLETLFRALPKIKFNCEIHLRGNYPASARNWLEPLMPDIWRKRIFIHETVSNFELLSRISEHDVGLALEPSLVLSTNLTVSNKLFQYLQAGLAVIATDTAGQQEIMKQCPGAGALIPDGDVAALAESINILLESSHKLSYAKNNALQAAQTQFCWEKQEATLIQAANYALQSK